MSGQSKALDDCTRSSLAMQLKQMQRRQSTSSDKVVSTDPPYYDNIGYADLSDFFYVWLRRSLKPVFPDLFATLAVPKAEELVATPYRHGSKEEAEAFFLDGMTQAMHRLAEQAHPAFPVTIYYAFKQAESDGDEGTASTGWDTFLDAVIRRRLRHQRHLADADGAEVRIDWHRHQRPRLQHRPRLPQTSADAPTATRREFVTALKAELPVALAHLQRGNIAPVDLAQAAIGPGMAVYTRYAQVLDAAGKPLTVREALALINQTLDEALAEQEGDFDADTRWAVAWFEQVGFNDGEYGVAETLSKAKNTSVAGMVEAGILVSRAGKVRLLRPDNCPQTGTRPRTSASRPGRRCTISSACWKAAARAQRRSWPPGWAARPRSPASWPTGSTPSASARSAPSRHSPTTGWCRAGRRSRAWRARAASLALRKAICLDRINRIDRMQG